MKKEAVLIVGALVVILQAVLGLLKEGTIDGETSQNAISAGQILIVAVGALFARRQVYSQNTHDAVVADLTAAEPVADNPDEGLWQD